MCLRCCWCTALQVSESMRIPSSPTVIYSHSFPHQHADLVISGFVFCGAQCAATVCCRICGWFVPCQICSQPPCRPATPTMWPVWQLNAAMIHIYWILFHPQPKVLLGKTSFVIKKGHVFNPPPCGWTALGVFGQSQQFLTLEFFVALRPGPRNHPTCNADCEHLGRQNNNFLDPTILKISKNFHLPQTRTFSKFSPVELFFVIAKRRRVSAMRWI